jgi:small subunit ribosomal protein S9
MVEIEKKVTDLADLAGTEVATEAPKREVKVDAFGRAYATGRRKESVARVWIKPGTGKVVVNGKEQSVYFGRKTHLLVLNQPFLVVKRMNQFDVMCTVKGGGLSGQAGAIRHAISRALENFEPTLRPALKEAGMMTRDARIVERKKIGKHKARRTKQWAKR